MKRRIAAIGLLVIALQSVLMTEVNAQERSKFEQEIAIGAQAGLNMSQVRFLHNDLTSENEIGNIGWRNGGSLGLAVRFIAQKHFGLQLEANYLQNGWKEKFDNDATPVNGVSFANAETERELDYLSIPLLAHIYWGNTTRFFVNMGPKIGLLLNSEDKKTLNSDQVAAIVANNPEDPRVNDNIDERKTDYGVCVGAGMELHLSRVNVLAEVRWTYGLQDVYPHDKSDVYQRSNHQNIAFTLGVLIPTLKFHSH